MKVSKRFVFFTLVLSFMLNCQIFAYDRHYASVYAYKWGQYGMYNTSEYYSASLDCTNFVSQCLEKGGYTRSTSLPSYGDTNYWRPHSGTWENATLFNQYWTKKGKFYKGWSLISNSRSTVAQTTYNDLYQGDVIQYGNSSSDIRHSQIVHNYGFSSMNGKPTLLIAQHTGNKVDIDIYEYLATTGYSYVCYFNMS